MNLVAYEPVLITYFQGSFKGVEVKNIDVGESDARDSRAKLRKNGQPNDANSATNIKYSEIIEISSFDQSDCAFCNLLPL